MPETPLPPASFSRRRFLRSAGLVVATLGAMPAFSAQIVTMPFANGQRQLVKYPQKRPLIRLTARPPQLETPFEIFNEGVITPNDAFFVRYHLADIPLSIDSETFRLAVQGSVKEAQSFSLLDLKKKFEPVEVTAVLQCSGNSRGFSQPRVAGGQLGHGAMGNAKWRGVRLRDVLDKVGVKATAKQVTFNGLDKGAMEKTPDFVKALDIDQARDGEVMLAYEMNGEPLPMLNGYPVRLVVPGYFGTYWVKHLSEITVVDEALNNFWMNPAYRIPDNDCACVPAGTKPEKTIPIQRYNIRSFITNLKDGELLKTGESNRVKGIAFDGGHGITEVQVSMDGGRSWQPMTLGKDLGKYSFREWEGSIRPPRPGKLDLMVRATNRLQQTQPLETLWNPAGYMRNVVETVHLISA